MFEIAMSKRLLARMVNCKAIYDFAEAHPTAVDDLECITSHVISWIARSCGTCYRTPRRLPRIARPVEILNDWAGDPTQNLLPRGVLPSRRTIVSTRTERHLSPTIDIVRGSSNHGSCGGFLH